MKSPGGSRFREPPEKVPRAPRFTAEERRVMPISMDCPSCLNAISLPDSAAGKKAKCPECQFVLFVPHPDPAVEAADTPAATVTETVAKPASKSAARPRRAGTPSAVTGRPTGSAPAEAAFDFGARPAPRRRRGKAGVILLVLFLLGGLGLTVVLAGGAGAAWYFGAWGWLQPAPAKTELLSQSDRLADSTRTAAQEPKTKEPPKKEPAKEPPAKDPPKKEPPTRVPLFDPPAKEPPVTDPPVKEPPVTRPPVQDPPKDPPVKVSPPPPKDPPKPPVPKTMRLTALKEVAVTSEGSVVLPVTIERQGFTGAVRLELASPNPQVTAKPVTIAEDGNAAGLELSAAKDAAPGTAKARVRASAGDLVAELRIDVVVKPKVVTVPETGGLLYVLKCHQGGVRGVAFSPDGLRLVTAGQDATVRIWNAVSGKQEKELDQENLKRFPIACARFSFDGKFVFAAQEGKGDEPLVLCWDAATGKLKARYPRLHKDGATSLALEPTGPLAVSGGHDRTVAVWSAAKANDKTKHLHGHFGAVLGVACSPDNRHALSCGADGTIRLWDLSAGREVGQYKGHKGEVHAVAYSADGALAVSGGQDRTVRVWDTKTARQAMALAGHTDAVLSVALSADGKLVASSGKDRTARLWSLETGKELFRTDGHTSEVKGVALSADGTRLATAGQDGDVRLWAAPPKK